MKIAKVQFTPWDKCYFFNPGELTVKRGDKVIVRTDLGTEMGEVESVLEVAQKDLAKCLKCKSRSLDEEMKAQEDNEEPELNIKPIERKATLEDFNYLVGIEERRQALEYVKKTKERLNLPMKFVDAHYAFDGSRITFAFIADGRVDFRELVKDLTRHFSRTIRLQQIGIRDEAKIMGDLGHCGKQLCCRTHLKQLSSITSDMADIQQCAHRGSERISGVCGRLLCCLAYEQEGYEDLKKNLPEIESQVTVEGKRGKVVGHHVLKQSVVVKFKGGKDDDYTMAEVLLEDLNKQKRKSRGRRRW